MSSIDWAMVNTKKMAVMPKTLKFTQAAVLSRKTSATPMTASLMRSITAVTTDTPPPGEALILFQDVSGDDLLGAGEA